MAHQLTVVVKWGSNFNFLKTGRIAGQNIGSRTNAIAPKMCWRECWAEIGSGIQQHIYFAIDRKPKNRQTTSLAILTTCPC